MKPTDTVTIELTLRELARVYAVMGKVRSIGSLKESIWMKARSILDPYGKHYRQITRKPVLDYCTYQEEWEAIFFEDETSRKVKELEETIKKAQEQIQELKGE